MQHPWRPALRSASGAVALEWWTPNDARTADWWVEAYAQRIARIADADEVAVHHLEGGLVLAEVVAPSRVGPDPTDLARGPYETRVPMAGQVTSRGDVLTTMSEATVHGRAILVTAHDPRGAAARRSTLCDRVLPALHAAPGVRGVRAHLTDGRQGESILGDVVVVEARDTDCALAAVHAAVDAFGADLADPRTHRVVTTQILREGGRPLLPAERPVDKPRLDPRRRPAPPPSPVSTTRALPPARTIELPAGFAEDVVVDGAGQLLCGVDGGAILRIDPETHTATTVASTGGRPLGLEHRSDDTLLVCDAHLGLLHLDLTTGEIATLTRFVDSRPLRFCSNATTLPDGTIWFTESTTRFDFEHHRGSMMENRPSGRLLRRSPDGSVTVIRDDLWFANGITATPDGTGLMVVETAGHRVNRFALTGTRAGAVDVVTAGLPGFPDNMSDFRTGRSWIPLTNPRMRALEMLGTKPRWVSEVAWRIPDRLRPEPEHTVWAVAIDDHGDIVDEVHGAHPDFHTATGAVEVGGKLFLSSVFCAPMLEIDLEAR
ncbi:SMP-30/gluconolactonase/LRE family protein [uncultured Williamsia sp.]|uniref:SMP-30/gluconolactonase/LRE family protein n=1 Tax=uncultured Williamsia sp. TaxID=259311 RepID=UPI0026122321|nr:SMP-30/gluconolactonase/LRE family protein [uncultured Williamsia sp.]